MQTAAIGYRVADFLKQHSPFHCVEEPDLLTLVSRGRVRFHEADEFLCWQNNAYSPYLLVIQRGSVSLWEQNGGKDSLRDIRGPGDLIGLERLHGSTTYPYSAKANEDVVVYALHIGDFEPLVPKYRPVARYIEACSSAGAVRGESERRGVHETFVAELTHTSEPIVCALDTALSEAARVMRNASASAIAVMEGDRLRGVLTSRDIVGWVGDGGSVSAAVEQVIGAVPPFLPPHTQVSECVLVMSGAGSEVAAMTTDGTAAGRVLRLISSADLQPAFGDNPLAILHQLASARDIETLRTLHLRARGFLLAQLTETSATDWLATLSDRINLSIVKRVIELAGVSSTDWNWCFWGAAGRAELLTAVEPGVAIICPNTADLSSARRTLVRLRNDLAACGFVPYADPEWKDLELCATAAAWQERFAEWIRDPVLSHQSLARPLFDLRSALGDPAPWRRLQRFARETIGKDLYFRKLLANDCLDALPPLTFFDDSVIDQSGVRSELFELERRALGPVVDVGRVFGILYDRVFGCPTLDRLELARCRMPEHEGVFRQAMQTMRVLLSLQARTGLRTHNSGADIRPSQLSGFDRQVLKTGFRAIHDLLEFTVEHLWEAAG